MALLKTLICPLAYTASPEMARLAEKWILRASYYMNYNTIQDQMKDKRFQGKSTHLEMQKKCQEYLEAIKDLSKTLDSSDFNPTPKDIRIMRICSFANVGKKDFGKTNGLIKFGSPTFILNGHREDSLKGYRELADEIYEYKKLYSKVGYRKKPQPALQEEKKQFIQMLGRFLRLNYNVCNKSDDIEDRSTIFSSRRLNYKDNFFDFLESLMILKRDVHDQAVGYNDGNFWNNVASAMYLLYTTENEAMPQLEIFPRGIAAKLKPNWESQPEITEQKEVKIGFPDSAKKQSKIKRITTEAIILSDNRKCVYKEHTLTDITIRVRVSTASGNIEWHDIPAAYCEECDAYFVLEMDFEKLCRYGVPLCPVIDKTTYLFNPERIHQNQRYGFNTESRIHQMGYNVSQASGYSKKQRELILANIIENTDITIHEIRSNIIRSINRHKNQANYQTAIGKWQSDLDFLSSYNIGDMPEVQVEKFVHGR